MTFREFFLALHGQIPFHWQERLAAEVAEGHWPDALALPTASGKTACIDIAVFAMVKQARLSRRQRTAPRRVFFVVDRRVIVDDAHSRMKAIAHSLLEAKDGVLREAADALCEIGGNARNPIVAFEMRGGIYRDHAWVRNPAQPALIASTVDQAGSRLLFRGYGVSPSAKPIHAALIANDALIVLDEAHCSIPFGQTLDWVRKYRETGGVAESVRLPFYVVEMSATPANARERRVFPLPADDRAEEYLGKRLRATKPAELVQVKKPGRDALEEELYRQAIRLASEDGGLKNVVVFVNRVRSARTVHEKLLTAGFKAVLMIGRMRPIDRDDLTRNLNQLRSGAPAPAKDAAPLFVVATQCLEVGADFDFDALITECASIDALRQRFGRLNRLGRDILARAAVAAPAGRLLDDPVYGDSIHHTWDWLRQLAAQAGTNAVNFANEGPGTVGESISLLTNEDLRRMRAESKNAPVLFREYLDIWSQTNPAPDPQPDPGHFLHGPDYESDDVQIVWRADLDGPEEWIDIVSLCPPSSAEAMPVSLRAFRRWLVTKSGDEDAADIAQRHTEERGRRPASEGRPFLVWRGIRESKVRTYGKDVRPGDTIVIPVSYGGWNELGYIPPAARIDRAEEALLQAKRRACLRLHPRLTDNWPNTSGKEPLFRAVAAGEKSEIQESLRRYHHEMANSEWLKQVIGALLKARASFDLVEYPRGDGYTIRSRGPAQIEEDDGEDDLSSSDVPVSLEVHTEHVRQWAGKLADALGLDDLKAEFETAATMHDWGKADERFQALLLGGDRWAAGFSPKLWAKSGQIAPAKAERKRQRELSGLPDHFRHEFLSLQLAESGNCTAWAGDKDLVLHLIAAHHGWGRPFAPVTIDEECPGLSLGKAGVALRWSKEERARTMVPHRVGSGIADRFWRLTRSMGWWGLAYAEAVFRLADWSASDQGAIKVEAEDNAA